MCRSGSCVLDARGVSGRAAVLSGIAPSLEGFDIPGDDTMYAGVVVTPSSIDALVHINNIYGMSLSNPGNDSPLSYGILAYGNGPTEMPVGTVLHGNTISQIAGSGISLGDYTLNTTITHNTIDTIIPVSYLGQDLSIGVQAQFAGNVNIEGNLFNNMIISSNLLASTGTLSSNNYGVVGSYLTTTAPLTVVFSDTVDWWLSETTIVELGISLLSYASTLELATESADAGSDIVSSDGTVTSQDCAGVWGGDAVADCAGTCNGTAVEDCAGVCDGSSVVDCAGTCGGDAVADPCGECNGDGVACSTVFNVDMNCAGTEFTTVHVTGPFCGWCGGEEWNTMSDEDGDGVYTLTLYGLEAPFEYKYMIDGFAGQETLYDDMAAGASCAPITDYWSYGNRQLDAVGGGLTVSETYGSCMTCDEQAAMLVSTIDFEVDMNGSMYPNGDYDNVVLNGDWPGAGPWNGWGLQLSDDDGDGVYTGSLTLDVGTSFEYVVAVTGSADGWSGWGQQFGQPACNGANFTATAPADGNTSTTVSISVDDLVADACGVCDGDDSTCTDDCGVVNGDNSSCADCAGVPYGTAFLDCNGTCADGSYLSWVGDGFCDATGYADNAVGYGLNFLCEEFGMDSGDCDSYQDCAGTYFGSLVEDCSGDCGGTLTLDYCGVCGGDNVANECEEAPVCGDDEFDCLGDGTECIPASWECDIYWADCSNGADEANCGGDDSAGGDCVNDDSTSDAYGDTCSGWYDDYEYPGSSGCMGAYDTADFTASEQCCACQGSMRGV